MLCMFSGCASRLVVLVAIAQTLSLKFCGNRLETNAVLTTSSPRCTINLSDTETSHMLKVGGLRDTAVLGE